jgi:1-acyl-sn-glycerol-3-phosphate acyltransferase
MGSVLLSRRDPRFIERLLRVVRPLSHRYFRGEVRGFEQLGAGPYLLVANHSIAGPWEILILLDAWVRQFGSARPVYGLAHHVGFRLPLVRSALRRVGAVLATHEAADEVLRSGASLIVFPGGNGEVARSFWRRDRCDLGGHRGWARIALRAQVPVVPIAIAGSHAVNPVLVASRFLAWLTLARLLFRVSSVPITVGQLLAAAATLGLAALFLPLWLAVLLAWEVFWSPTSVFLPLLPSKIVATVGEPIDLAALAADHPDEPSALAAAYTLVETRLQAGIDALVAERRGVLG